MPHLALLSQLFIGYWVTFEGNLIGAAYGFVCGFAVGALVTKLQKSIDSPVIGGEMIRFVLMYIINTPEFISAISALSSFVFAIYVYYQTRRILKPTDRPFVALIDRKCQEQRSNDSVIATCVIHFELKNIGKKPAKDIRIRLARGHKDSTEAFRHQDDVTMANRLDADTTTTFPYLFKISINLTGKEGSEGLEVALRELYIYLLMTYKDQFNQKKLYSDEFWLKYIIGSSQIQHATLQDKLNLEPYINSIYGKERENCRLL